MIKVSIRLAAFLLCFICNLPLHAQVGYITTVAGNGINTNSGDGSPATAASIANPNGIHVDWSSNLYINEIDRIRMINTAGIITTFSGTGSSTTDGVPATAAHLLAVHDVNSDSLGNIYITDAGTFHIRKVNAAGIITTIAGSGSGVASGTGGPATAAGLEALQGVAADGAGNVYFAEGDAYANDVRRIDAAGIVHAFAGGGGSLGDGGPATAASLSWPDLIRLDRFGNMYIPEFYGNRVRKIDAATGTITTIAGTGSGGFSGDGGAATSAKLSGPTGVAIDGAGNVYIADYQNERIRKVNTAGIITTITGNGTPLYNGDNQPATAAEISNAEGVAVDCAGNIYIADLGNMRIRMVKVANNAPAFTGGHARYVTVCAHTPLSIDTLLTATDLDTGQRLTWSVATAPAHGSVTGLSTVYTTGIAITPTGAVYTAVTGYTGADSFKVVAMDCGGLSDTVVIHIAVTSGPNAGIISGVDSICIGHVAMLTKTVSGGVWSSSDTALVTITGAGVVTGHTAGIDTIIYTVTDTLGCASQVTHIIKVKNCIDYVPQVQEQQFISLYPNPARGSFKLLVVAPGSESVNVVITDITGAVIKRLTVAANEVTDISLNAALGLYFVTAATPQGKTCQKLVLQ